MAKVIRGNRKINCPHCGEPVGHVGDFVIPGRIGPSSVSREYSDCGDCDGIFSVEKTSATEYTLTPVQGRHGDTRP